jgi:hypothetical protein
MMREIYNIIRIVIYTGHVVLLGECHREGLLHVAVMGRPGAHVRFGGESSRNMSISKTSRVREL